MTATLFCPLPCPPTPCLTLLYLTLSYSSLPYTTWPHPTPPSPTLPLPYPELGFWSLLILRGEQKEQLWGFIKDVSNLNSTEVLMRKLNTPKNKEGSVLRVRPLELLVLMIHLPTVSSVVWKWAETSQQHRNNTAESFTIAAPDTVFMLLIPDISVQFGWQKMI